MTERTLRAIAVDFAGQFYDQVRSAESQGKKGEIKRGERVLMTIDPTAFRKTFPTLKDYLLGRRHGRMMRKLDGTVFHVDDGSIHDDTPGWLHFYDMARQLAVQMLRPDSGVSEHLKPGIMEALVEDRTKQLKQTDPRQSPNIHQRHYLQH